MLLDSIVLRFIPKFPHALLGCLYFRLKCACIVLIRTRFSFCFSFKFRFQMSNHSILIVFLCHDWIIYFTKFVHCIQFPPPPFISHSILILTKMIHSIHIRCKHLKYLIFHHEFFFVQIESPHIFSYTTYSTVNGLGSISL